MIAQCPLPPWGLMINVKHVYGPLLIVIIICCFKYLTFQNILRKCLPTQDIYNNSNARKKLRRITMWGLGDKEVFGLE